MEIVVSLFAEPANNAALVMSYYMACGRETVSGAVIEMQH
jgi:hypothetical protein